MGGPGSTRWDGHARRRTVEDARALGARTVARELALPAVVGRRTVTVERGRSWGARTAYVLTLDGVAQPRGGGVRWWCVCGRCGVRRRALYLTVDETRAACRACLDLGYRSQRLSQDQRLVRRAARLARQLGAEDLFTAEWGRALAEIMGRPAPDIVEVRDVVDDNVIPKRPKGMHRRRYRRLRADLERVLEERDGIVYEALRHFVDSGRRKAALAAHDGGNRG